MVPNRAKHHIWFSQNLTVHHFQHKKKIHQWVRVMAKAKKNYFGGVLGVFPQNETLFEKFDLVNFLPL